MKSIGQAAFAESRGLTEVFCLAENVPGTGRDVFKNSPISLATLYVPEESVETYWQTSPWSGFGTIAALPTEVVTFAKDQMATIILPTAPDASKGFISRAGRSC